MAKWKHAGKIRSAMRVRENQRTVMPRASTPDDIIMATSSWELSVNISSSTLYISSCNHQRLSMSSLVLFFSFNTRENWDTKRSSDLHVFQGYCLLESGFKPKSYSFRTSRALLYPWVPSVWNWSRWVFPSLTKKGINTAHLYLMAIQLHTKDAGDLQYYKPWMQQQNYFFFLSGSMLFCVQNRSEFLKISLWQFLRWQFGMREPWKSNEATFLKTFRVLHGKPSMKVHTISQQRSGGKAAFPYSPRHTQRGNVTQRGSP